MSAASYARTPLATPTLDAPKLHSLGRWSIVLVLVMVGVSGCAYQPLSIPPPDAPGFWLGVWHGFIAPISLFGSFFADHRIYSFPNLGVLYDLGFLLGLSAWGGGGAYSARG
jgi:hypothetical protein